VHFSPAIMKVAVPLLQHSQWFGHLALSHTVFNRNSLSSARVREKALVCGNVIRSHAGKRGRALISASFNPGISYPFQKLRQLVGSKVSEYLSIHIKNRREILAREPDHLVISRLIGNDIYFLVFHPMRIEPMHRLVTPPAVRFDE